VPLKKTFYPEDADRLLHSIGLHAKKRLGQHFLIDVSVKEKILRAAELSPHDAVVEVGPGLGILTEELVKQAGSIIAVELDVDLAKRLQKKLSNYANIRIITDDILKLDLDGLLGNEKNYKVVANIPYYITSPLLHYFIYKVTRPSMMIIMMQKEVALDIASPPGKMSYLSLSMQLFSHPEIICEVPASCFYPPPRVDSAVVKFFMRQSPALEVDDINGFLEFVHKGFGAPRKKISNSLAIGMKIEPLRANKILEEAGLDAQRRPGALSMEEWKRLYDLTKGMM